METPSKKRKAHEAGQEALSTRDWASTMKITKCSCRSCRRGLRTRCQSKLVVLKVRAARHRAKQDLKEDKEPETRVLVGYTD